MQRQLANAKQEFVAEVKQHFDVVVENIRHDLEGANRDELSLVRNTLGNHEKRLQHLEHFVGTT